MLQEPKQITESSSKQSNLIGFLPEDLDVETKEDLRRLLLVYVENKLQLNENMKGILNTPEFEKDLQKYYICRMDFTVNECENNKCAKRSYFPKSCKRPFCEYCKNYLRFRKKDQYREILQKCRIANNIWERGLRAITLTIKKIHGIDNAYEEIKRVTANLERSEYFKGKVHGAIGTTEFVPYTRQYNLSPELSDYDRKKLKRLKCKLSYNKKTKVIQFSSLRDLDIFDDYLLFKKIDLTLSDKTTIDLWNIHKHLIADSEYIPMKHEKGEYSEFAKHWKKITGNSYIVHVKKVKDIEIDLNYLLGYSLKGVSHMDDDSFRKYYSFTKKKKLSFTLGYFRKKKFVKEKTKVKCIACGSDTKYVACASIHDLIRILENNPEKELLIKNFTKNNSKKRRDEEKMKNVSVQRRLEGDNILSS